MSDWFDSNNKNSDENKNAESTPETKKDTESTNWPNENAEPNQAGDHEWKQSGWAVPPVSPPAVPSWSSPGGNGGSQETNSEAPSRNSPDSTGDTQDSGNAASTGSSTYHYGVNAQNPVPNSTNQYPNQPPYNYNGYQPQGGYNPYGWQRVPNQPNMQPNIPQKPPKKKRGAAIAIATISVMCAAAIIVLSVLLAMAINNNELGNNTGNESSRSTSSSVNSNGPNLEIAENDADAQGLSTRSIVEMNLNSTVVVTVWDRRSSFGFGGGSQLQEVGAASGIIMSANGYIITNWHVVIDENTGNAYERIDVKTYDGTVYKDAQIIGADRDTDLAVIKVGAAKLTPSEFGDSGALKLGDKIVAIGNAGGLAWTTTQGIVSGLARDVYEDTGYAIKCLQIDAAINPGNSGGPLLNSRGQVVGVNSAKIVAQGYEGLGFSIPIKEAKLIIDDLIKFGITQPGYEGFQIQTIDEKSCLKGTDARVGDIITKIDNVTVKSGTALRSELSKYKVGDKITLTLMRVDTRTGARNNFTVKCTLAEFGG